MNRTLLRPSLLALLAFACAQAAEPAKPAEQSKPADQPKEAAGKDAKDQTPADTLRLPTLQINEKRVKQIDDEIKQVDKQIAREKKNLKATNLDKSLNSDQLAKAAAIFGGNSASHMQAVAASRINMLENERALLERLKFPRTEEDQALIEKELVNVRKTRRELDDATKQR